MYKGLILILLREIMAEWIGPVPRHGLFTTNSYIILWGPTRDSALGESSLFFESNSGGGGGGGGGDMHGQGVPLTGKNNYHFLFISLFASISVLFYV